MRRHLPEPVLDETAFVSLGPIIEPPFADARPGEVTAVLEDVREVASEPWDPPLTADLAARALAVALHGRLGSPQEDDLRKHVPSEDTDGQDIVIWYAAHLNHIANDHGDEWHVCGPILQPFGY